MAKNKKSRNQEQNRSEAERGRESAEKSAAEATARPMSQAQGSPADVARKHQRRFGHN